MSYIGHGLLNICFLDVGQGDATFIVFPDGTTMLVDLGSSKNASFAGEDAIQFLKKVLVDGEYGLKNYRGSKGRLAKKGNLDVVPIDYLIVTHAHVDHYNLLLKLGNIIGLDNLYTKAYFGGNKAAYQKASMIHTILQSSYKSIQYLSKSLIKRIGSSANGIDGVKVKFLCGGWGSLGDNVNNDSIVLSLEYGGRRVLLPGDAEMAVENHLLNKYGTSLKADILKLGHHGSNTANSINWLKAVDPGFIFCSSDIFGGWCHPHKITKVNCLDHLKNKGRQVENHYILFGEDSYSDYKQELTKLPFFTNLVYQDSQGVVAGGQYNVQLSINGDIGVNYVGFYNNGIPSSQEIYSGH